MLFGWWTREVPFAGCIPLAAGLVLLAVVAARKAVNSMATADVGIAIQSAADHLSGYQFGRFSTRSWLKKLFSFSGLITPGQMQSDMNPSMSVKERLWRLESDVADIKAKQRCAQLWFLITLIPAVVSVVGVVILFLD